MATKPESKIDSEEKGLLEAMLHRLELIKQYDEQQLAALRSLYLEIAGLRTDILSLLKVQSEEK